MLCGPFMLYTDINITTFDGSNCSQLEPAVYTFTWVTCFIAGVVTLAGFCSASPSVCIISIIAAVVLIAISPFALYILMILLAVLLIYFTWKCLVHINKPGGTYTHSEYSDPIFSHVQIDPIP